jgi:pyruvate formate-lyase/glycerol dehydratase family glycyl radical enzyme
MFESADAEALAAFPPEVWDSTRPDDRAARIRARLLAAERWVDVERARYTTASYHATEGWPMPIRRGQMLLDLVRQMQIAIEPDELIVGNRSLLPRTGVIAPEGAVDWVDRELDILSTRPQDRFQITPAAIHELREDIFPYWRGKTLEDAVAARIPDDVRRAVAGKAFTLNQTDHAQGHILPDVEGWLRKGIEGIRAELGPEPHPYPEPHPRPLSSEERGGLLAQHPEPHPQPLSSEERGVLPTQRGVSPSPLRGGGQGGEVFHTAAHLALDAAEAFILRYATLADEMIAETDDPVRRGELAEIAERCRWLAVHPARDFPEALQAVWFLFVLLQIESNASSFSPGRLDQYLYPYLCADLDAGRLDLPAAQAWLEQLWLKFNEIVLLRSSASSRYFAGFPIGFNVVVGGQVVAELVGSEPGDSEPGDSHAACMARTRDATNRLSYMCLRAQADLGLTQPNLSIRIHRDSPQAFLRAAAAVIGRGGGMPQVFNDEVIIPGQIRRGIAPADAVNYAVVGCVELSSPGKALGWSDSAMFNMARVLELTLFGGQDPASGEQIGLQTPPLDRMASMADLEAAYDAQLAHFVGLMVTGCDVIDAIHAEMLPSPFLSLVVQDCVARGVDVTAGGAHYNFSGPQGVQIANVADSLAAIQAAVFAEHWLSAADLLAALAADFDGQELLRQRLLNRAPKYGNDDDRVDAFAARWANRYCELVGAYPTVRGGTYQPGFYTVSAHVPMGANVGATPDGRRAQTPLADGGLSPAAGRDRRGATAALSSVGKLNLELASNGTLLNMKFLPTFFSGPASLDKFVLLLRGFCRLRIPHVQFNVVSAEMLCAAQTQPEEYRHLVVRVAGYSAYFTELDRGLQDEIIARTAYAGVG